MLVVGLGPVGSLGAVLFAEAGLKVAAIEKDADVYTLPRAVNLDGEIIRALQPMGLAATVQKMMQPYVSANGQASPTPNVNGFSASMHSRGAATAGSRRICLISRNSRLFYGGRPLSHANVTTYIGYEMTRFLMTLVM